MTKFDDKLHLALAFVSWAQQGEVGTLVKWGI